MSHHQHGPRVARMLATVRRRTSLLTGAALAAFAVPALALGGPAAAPAAAAAHAPGGCHLGNGVKHVIEISFDNVHFFRDNPNVPSDLQMMPHLLHFLEDNGTVASNNHTPLIAHTGDDLLTTFTGLYGDRQGMPISNSLPDLQPRRHHRPGRLVRVLDRPGLQHRDAPQPGPRHQPVHGVRARSTGHRRAPAGAGHNHPGAVGAFHPGRL